MNHPAAPPPLDAEDRSTLEVWARSATAPHRVVSCRSMAEAAGVSRSTVQRIRDAHGLQPHRVTTFELSKDPAFVQKLTDVVGLYLNPPDQAVVPCVDEKSRIQALDRTQPGLPMKPGRCGGRKNGMTRSVGADWGPQILRKSQKS